HGVVDEDLDVLAEVRPVPERRLQLGEAVVQPAEHRAQGRAVGQRLLEEPPRRAVAADEARGPADDLDENRGHPPARRSFSCRNSPRLRSRLTSSPYELVRMMRSNCAR